MLCPTTLGETASSPGSPGSSSVSSSKANNKIEVIRIRIHDIAYSDLDAT